MMTTTLKRRAQAGASNLFRAAFVLMFALTAAGSAQALKCNGPKPPPACEGPPDPPPPPLQRPLIDAFGDDFYYRIHIGVKAQDADASQVKSYTVQIAPNAAGPWSTVQSNVPYFTDPFRLNTLTYDYAAPSPQFCTRARVHRSTADFSPWSITKCANQSPVPSSIQITVGSGGITLRWLDLALFDSYYGVLYRSASSGSYTYFPALGNYGATGQREVTIPVTNPPSAVCVVMWPLEIAPGYVGGFVPPDFSESTPMSPYHWKSTEVCSGFGF
jgi:hypothetical protein